MPFPTGSVLIVDDSAQWRAQVRELLREQPELQIIAEARDGREAVRKTLELHPDLVLLDIGMPVLNGCDAADQIRQVSPRSRIVFLTQENDVDIRSAVLAAGAHGYVSKINASSELLPTIAAVLRDHQRTSQTATSSV